LAMVVWQKPNLLVLDEPTNHLDLEMRHAMEVALQAYDGALVLVSHDRHMLRNTAEELLLVHDGCVEEYREDLEGYERWILSSYKSTEKRDVAAADSSRKEKRQQAATQRDKLRPLQKQVNKTEAQMAEVERALHALREQMSDTDLYTENNKQTLAGLLKREGELKIRAEELDELWLEQQQQLEELAQ
ncbi:MAG: ABC transporter ATP-binding protein, partial [Halioglobus sp.]|nr:ABC transporter ATP-binding protein [Halioglobus sp.]